MFEIMVFSIFFGNNLKLEGQCVVIQYKNVVFDYRR